MKHFLALIALLSVSSLSSASPLALAQQGPAQLAPSWYLGDWSCTIDRRAGRMVWQVGSDFQVRGWFKDGNGGWVSLVSGSAAAYDLRFTYTGDNTRWFLRYDPQTGVANGNTIWRGNTFPLNCSQGKG